MSDTDLTLEERARVGCLGLFLMAVGITATVGHVFGWLAVYVTVFIFGAVTFMIAVADELKAKRRINAKLIEQRRQEQIRESNAASQTSTQ